MAGFTSLDDLINEMTANGKFWRADWNKLTHAVGTNLAFHAAHDRLQGSIYHGGDVGADFKSILNASAFSAAATTMPAIFMLVDMLGWYPVTTTTTTGNQALVNSATVTASSSSGLLLTYAGWAR